VRCTVLRAAWVKDIESSMSSGRKVEFPIIADPDRKIAKQ
jgi:alkyl hydroperoxide reductase subunit AhpC